MDSVNRHQDRSNRAPAAVVLEHTLVWTIVAIAALPVGCQEPHNIRMRFAAMVPGSPEQLVGVDAKNRVLLCDPKSQQVIHELGAHRTAVRELRVSPEGTYVATVGTDGVCHVWNVTPGEPGLTINLPGSGTDRGAAAFSSDGGHIACGGAGVVDIYALPDGKLVRRIPDENQPMFYQGGDFEKLRDTLREARILSLDIKPFRHRLLLGTDRGVYEIDYLRCEIVWRPTKGGNQAATLVRYAPNGDDFIVQSASGKLDYFVGHKPIVSLEPGDPKKGTRTKARFTAAEFTCDGAYLALLGTDGYFRVVRLSDRKLVLRVAPGMLDHGGLALGSDRRYAWVSSQGNVERFTRFTLPEEMRVKAANLE